jgi:putative spermidine/putrescine transport system ATP-binding protein
MNNGVIEQYDTPENIYSRPKTEFVARFIGFENFIELKKQSNHLYSTNENENIYVENENSLENGLGTIRPEDIRIVDEDIDKNTIVGTIGVRTFLGKAYQYEVNTLLGKLIVNAPIDIVHETGEQVKLYLPENKIILVKKSM